MPHFIINSNCINNGYIIVSDKELYNHIAKSLRVKVNQTLMFIDENEIQYITDVETINNKEIKTKIVDSYKSNRKISLNLILAQSILKPDAQFSIIQKATELGVKEILPLLTDNSTVKHNIAINRQEKWQKIALEAVKQCERADIPQINPAQSFDELMNDLKQYDYIIAFVEKNSNLTLKQYTQKTTINTNKKILVIIGPEGGFSDREFKIFEQKKIPMITLGNLIYKADTAAIAALSTLIYELQNE